MGELSYFLPRELMFTLALKEAQSVGEGLVIEQKQAEPVGESRQATRRRCPTCAAFPRLARSMLDTGRGKTVRLYECQCGERIWDD